MTTNIIPRPSTAYANTEGDDLITRLMRARLAVTGDEEDTAAGYARTPGLLEEERRIEAEYEATYGEPAPKSMGMLALKRAQLARPENAST